MAAIGLMLALIFYIFAVMFTQLFDELHYDDQEHQTESNYFGSMGWTLFTLFQMMTLDNWASICREVMETFPWAWLPFVAFVIISGFIVVNLIIAVICDAISSLHKDEKAKLQGNYGDQFSDSSPPPEIREQLDSLEEQMEELTRVQARTFHTLQYLTRQMQMHKLKQELTHRGNIADAARNLRRVQRQLSESNRSSKEKGIGDTSSRSSTSKAIGGSNRSWSMSQEFGDSNRSSKGMQTIENKRSSDGEEDLKRTSKAQEFNALNNKNSSQSKDSGNSSLQPRTSEKVEPSNRQEEAPEIQKGQGES